MSFLGRFFNSQQPIEPVQKALAPFAVSAGADIIQPDNDVRGDYSLPAREQKRMELDALWRSYEKSPWIRKCVKAIAVAISKKAEIVPRNPQEQVDEQKADRVLSFLNNLYADPNTPETLEAFIRKTVIAMLVFGHVVCELRTTSGKQNLKQKLTKAIEDKFGPELAKAYDNSQGFGPMIMPNYAQEIEDAVGAMPEDGIPAYLRILPTQSIEVIADVKGNIKQFNQWPQNGKKIIFKPEEILHLIHPDAFDFSYGESQIASLSLLAAIDRMIDERQKNVLKGDSAIDTLFTLPEGRDTPENIKRLSQELVTKYRGADAALRFLVAPNGVKAEDLTKGKDGEFLSLKQWLREEICLCLGVPLSVVGESSGTAGKGSGADSHLRNFVEGTCRPIAVHIEAAFNRSIMSRFKAEGIDYILKLVLEDADDMTDIIGQLDTQVRAGLLTNNEARKELNLPPEDGGDVLWVDAKSPTRLSDLAAGPIAMNPQGMNPGALAAHGDAPPAPAADAKQQKAVEKAQAALRDLRKVL